MEKSNKHFWELYWGDIPVVADKDVGSKVDAFANTLDHIEAIDGIAVRNASMNLGRQIIMDNSGVPVRVGGDRAFYSPALDFIQVPPSVAFKSAAEEACVRIHELSHGSGAQHRLNRDLSGSFGSKKYAFEELVAEITSSFVGVNLNLPTDIPNHANYIGHWLEILEEDKRAVFRAAALAQKSADWILNLHPDYLSAQNEPVRLGCDMTSVNAEVTVPSP